MKRFLDPSISPGFPLAYETMTMERNAEANIIDRDVIN